MKLKMLIGALFFSMGCQGEADQPSRNPEVLAQHNQAVAAMGAFDYPRAMDVLSPLAATYPDWSDVQVDLSIAQLNRQQDGDEAAALRRLEGVLANEPDHERAAFTSGILCLHAGDIDQAATYFKHVIALDPEDAYASYYLGQVMMQQGHLEEALPLFADAIDRDPYLRSALYAGAQTARRLGLESQAQDWQDLFAKLEHNPRARLAEIKYTRMGPKAELKAISAGVSSPPDPPQGVVFADMTSCGVDDVRQKRPQSITIGQQPGGEQVIAVTGDQGLRLYRWPAGSTCPEHLDILPSGLEDIQSTMWADVDDDGYLDLVLLKSETAELWRGNARGGWERDDRFPVAPGSPVDAAIFDADHDGDVDVLIVSGSGRPSSLLNNNGDGTWRELLNQDTRFPHAITDARQVLVADFDGDLDTDIFVINTQTPHSMWINDRLWSWSEAPASWADLLNADITAAVAADLDADGQVDVVAMDQQGRVMQWSRAGQQWAGQRVGSFSIVDEDLASAPQMAVVDANGDGKLNVLASDGHGALRLLDPSGEEIQSISLDGVWTLASRDSQRGPGVLVASDAGLGFIPPGAGRWPFVTVWLSGRTDVGQSMRSNSSGIGSKLAARVQDRWTIYETVRATAGPGQSLQPISIGLGPSQAVDFVSIDWTDGVFQTESLLRPDDTHTIVETQRQLSSCPLIFAWNGEAMQFVTDCLGVGGLGFYLGPQKYAHPRPHERVLMPDEVLPVEASEWTLVLAEPMQETCYLDSAVLEVVDLPPGWEVLPDERMGTAAPMPTSRLLYSRSSILPSHAMMNGRDVLSQVCSVDGLACDPGGLDRRFLGRLLGPCQMEVQWSKPIPHDEEAFLVLDGWVEYPYSQTMFAAWQAGLSYRPLTIEARSGDGPWVRLHTEVGYPAGMQRTSLLPLHGIPEGADQIRLMTDLDLSVDALRVAIVEPCDDAVVHRIRPHRAVLEDIGYPAHTSRSPHDFDYSSRVPFWDVRSQRGAYTRLGDVSSLVTEVDGGCVVFGAGDAVHLQYLAPSLPESDWNRQWVMDLHGWCKDMDLMTRNGGTVDPVPGEGHARMRGMELRTRHRSGR